MMTLRDARLAKGRTQLDIQRDLGIFQTKISREESGIRTLTILEMKALETYLGSEINWVPQRSLTNIQLEELQNAVIEMMCRFGELETFKFNSRFRSLSEMYDVLCGSRSEQEPLPLPDHSRG